MHYSNPDNYIAKFSDDTSILGLMYKDADTTLYRLEIQSLSSGVLSTMSSLV